MHSSNSEEEYEIFVKRGGPDLIFQIGVDLTPRSYGLSLNPSVGVSHGRVSALAADFYGLHEGACMVGASLADLFVAEGREGGMLPRWALFPSDDIGSFVEALMLDLRKYGFPFLRRFKSLPDIVQNLECGPKSQFDLAHLAVSYAEMGDLRGSRAALDKMMAAADSEPRFVAEQTRRFVFNLKKHYQIGG